MWNVWMAGWWARGCGLNIQPWTLSEREGQARGHMHMRAPRRASRQGDQILPFRAKAVNLGLAFQDLYDSTSPILKKWASALRSSAEQKQHIWDFQGIRRRIFSGGCIRLRFYLLLFASISAEKCAFLPLMSGWSVSVYLHRDIQCLDNVLVQNIPEIKHCLSAPAVFWTSFWTLCLLGQKMIFSFFLTKTARENIVLSSRVVYQQKEESHSKKV